MAEVAVAFAGFASVVGIFAGRSGHQASRIDANRLRTMLTCSLSVVALSLVPFVPLGYGVSESASWRMSSAAVLAATVGVAARILLDYAALRRAGGRVGVGIRVLNSILVIVPLLLATSNLIGWSGTSAPASYLVSLLSLLLLAGIMFARLIESFLLVPPAA
jgi:Kef-type K+ transport system membrane component KefB